MTTHALHYGDPNYSIHEHGLADDCERCMELAYHPAETLDATMLANLKQRIEDGEEGRSTAESVAMVRLAGALRLSMAAHKPVHDMTDDELVGALKGMLDA